jgi:predicted unusual protein kinase regulating ubiquinone biosynthesis (AarF/ABC1/UbiB family)
MATDLRLPPALASLLDAGMAIARQAPSSRVTAGRLHGVVRPELLPAVMRADAIAAIERSLHSTAEPPLPGRDIEKILQSEWGRPPGKVLEDIDLDEPLSSRPHTQTHRATLDGETVAVKVARPRVASSLRTDLQLMDALAGPIGAVFPALDARALIREVRERVMDELDLEHEGEVHRRVARGLRRVDGVTVARVDSELTTPGVHVSAFLEGPTLADGPPADPGAAARTLVRVFAGAPTAIGLVLANPRANDVVLLSDGGVGLIGPGAARSVDPYRHGEIKAALVALRDGDRKAFVAAVAKLDLLPDKHAGEAYDLIEELLGDLLMNGPARLDDEVLAAAGDAALERIDELVALGAHGRPDPADVWPARMLGQLTSTLAKLGATEDWLVLAADALEDGWR